MPPQKVTEETDVALPDRMAETFSKQTVLITGGTGFVGKVLVEKLLRKCLGINQIVLLVREKKGMDPQERLRHLLNSPIYEKVIGLYGGTAAVLKKLTVVGGDCEAHDLALSASDRQFVIDNVNIIVHSAATVRFDEKLRKTILLNVRGTKLVLELAKSCNKLKLFVHLSTAYVQPLEKTLEEKIYPAPADPHAAIKTAELFDESTLELIAPKILNKLPNYYTFTKQLSEALASDARNEGMPLIVLRPSIIIPTQHEPIKGWTDNLNGPTGLLMAAGRGVLRTMYCNKDNYADFIPVDICVNGIVIAIWNYLSYGDTKTVIMNFTSTEEIKFTWQEIIECGKKMVCTKVPLSGVVWYPGGTLKSSRLHHNICAILLHWIPAVIADALLVVLRIRPVLCYVHHRISKGVDMLEFYANNVWAFRCENVILMRNRLNIRERTEYKFDSEGIKLEVYMEDCLLSLRRHMLKVCDDDLPRDKKRMQTMKFLHLTVCALFWFWIFSTLFRYIWY